MQRYAMEEKSIREENIRLQRKLQLEVLIATCYIHILLLWHVHVGL